MQAITFFFDAVDLITKRLPGLTHLVVELILLVLAMYGGYTLFKNHPN